MIFKEGDDDKLDELVIIQERGEGEYANFMQLQNSFSPGASNLTPQQFSPNQHIIATNNIGMSNSTKQCENGNHNNYNDYKRPSYDGALVDNYSALNHPPADTARKVTRNLVKTGYEDFLYGSHVPGKNLNGWKRVQTFHVKKIFH